jgi:hypothetical protein
VAETVTIRRWLFATLTADAPLTATVGHRIYHGVAPADVAYPFVVYQLLSPGNDRIALTGARAWVDTLWLVKVVVQANSSGGVEAAADRIDALLHNGRGTASGGIVIESRRERPHELPEVTGGVRYLNLGGEYRIRAQAA